MDDPVAEQVFDARRVSGGRPAAREPRLDLERPLQVALVSDLEACQLEEALPFGDAVVPHVTRVAQPVGLFRRLADEGVVADHDVAAPGRDVEHRDAVARLAPLDDEVEIVADRVDRALPVQLGAVAPHVAHRASSTAFFAPSSIVASGWMFGLPASARILRPSSAFVPSRRTTIGYFDMSSRSSASRIARATSSQRVIPPKMLKKIDL